MAGELVLPGLEQLVNTRHRRQPAARATARTPPSRKGAATTGWSPSATGPPTSSKVRKLLLDLGALNVVEEKTRLPANYPRSGSRT